MKKIVAVLVLFLVAGLSVTKGQISSDENKKINHLISYVENLKGHKFIRNGREYEASDAVKLLQRKRERKAATINSARDFIDQTATRSSTTGRPYLVKKPDGKIVPLKDFLTEELKRFEKK